MVPLRACAQNTKCTDGDVAVCRAHTALMSWGWFECNTGSPTWHSLCSGLHVTAAKNTPVGGTNIQTAHYPRGWHIHLSEGSKRNEYLWVPWPLLCNEKWYLLVFVVSVLEWILQWMGRGSQCIKVKQFDLYFKGLRLFGCDVNWLPWITFMTCKWPFGFGH